MTIPFRVGQEYTRAAIFDLLGLDPHQSGGNWFTGYNRHEDDWYIFAGVGARGRTGHKYGNHWAGDRLVWEGKTGSHLDQASIRSLLDPPGRVYVFTRDDDRSPFTYEGSARAAEVRATVPVTVVWAFDAPGEFHPTARPEEVTETLTYPEGAVRQVTVNAYERDPRARRACLRHHGYDCAACGFNFRAFYGDLAGDYIHVHHRRPLSAVGDEYQVDPVKDLVPVCPNCHAVVHMTVPPMEVESLRDALRERQRTMTPSQEAIQ